MVIGGLAMLTTGSSAMLTAGAVSFGYDGNGNMTSKTENSQTTTYSYDYENHMTGITYPDQSTNSFGYYGTGQRAWKVDSGGTSRFVYDGDEYGAPILAEVGGGGDYIATYTHGVHGLVSQRRGSTTNWYHYDDLGSTRNLTNSSQTITDAYTYKAFGEIPAASGSTTNPFRYIGSLNYYQDADSTFLLLGARYYGPQWGRFTTVDPWDQQSNRYRYARNRPAAGTDPNGLQVGPEDVVNVWTIYLLSRELGRILEWERVGCRICWYWYKMQGGQDQPTPGWDPKKFCPGRMKRATISPGEYATLFATDVKVPAVPGAYLGPPTRYDPTVPRPGAGRRMLMWAWCGNFGSGFPSVWNPNANEGLGAWIACRNEPPGLPDD